jgi:hypothetical protein
MRLDGFCHKAEGCLVWFEFEQADDLSRRGRYNNRTGAAGVAMEKLRTASTVFIGRDSELAKIAQRLADRAC